MAIERLTTAAATGQTTIADIVQVTLRKNTVLAPLFLDMSRYAEPGSKQVSFPRLTNEFTVQNLSGGVKADDGELIYTNDTIDLTSENHIQWVIRNFDQAKAKIDILQSAIMEATKQHAIKLDTDMFTEFSTNVAAGNVVTAGALTQAKVTEMIQKANEANMPQEGRAFVFSNSTYSYLIAINAFVDASANGRSAPIATGEIGTLYGIPVFRSAVVTTDTSWLVHRDALAYAFGALPMLEDEKVISYGAGSRRWALSQMYGVKSLNSGNLVVKLAAS